MIRDTQQLREATGRDQLTSKGFTSRQNGRLRGSAQSLVQELSPVSDRPQLSEVIYITD